jgi:hypothetical protein
VFNSLRRSYDGSIQHILVDDFAGNFVGFTDQPIDCRTLDSLRLLAELLEDLAEPGDLVWKPDTTVSSEVEVRFIAEGANATRVELEHRKFEQMGAEAGEKMRKDVDGGWPRLLEIFKQKAESA